MKRAVLSIAIGCVLLIGLPVLAGERGDTTDAEEGMIRGSVGIGMAAPGWIETGLWGGIKFPFSIELAKAINDVLKEWSDEKLCKLGFPFAPVWAAMDALPKDADKSLSLAEAVKNEWARRTDAPAPTPVLAPWCENRGGESSKENAPKSNPGLPGRRSALRWPRKVQSAVRTPPL